MPPSKVIGCVMSMVVAFGGKNRVNTGLDATRRAGHTAQAQ